LRWHWQAGDWYGCPTTISEEQSVDAAPGNRRWVDPPSHRCTVASSASARWFPRYRHWRAGISQNSIPQHRALRDDLAHPCQLLHTSGYCTRFPRSMPATLHSSSQSGTQPLLIFGECLLSRHR
jgi:hypothetical protein